MRNAYLSLGVKADWEAERMFTALAEGREVFMPMQETFFATHSYAPEYSRAHRISSAEYFGTGLSFDSTSIDT